MFILNVGAKVNNGNRFVPRHLIWSFQKKGVVTMQTARKLYDKDVGPAATDNDDIIITALYGRVDNKLGKAEALMPGFFNSVLKSLLLRNPFFTDCLQPRIETSTPPTVVELRNLDSELDEIINRLKFSDQADVDAKFIEAFDRLSVCSQANVAHLIYGYLLAESWERSKNTRSMIAENMLKIEKLSPSFGVDVIPILWQGGQKVDAESPFTKCISPHDQLNALDEFADALQLLTTLLEHGKAGNAAEEFNSLYTALPAGAKEMLLDVLAVVGEEMVGADTMFALIESYA
jgi:hypothetical protein